MMANRLDGLTPHQVQWITLFENATNSKVNNDWLRELRAGRAQWDDFMYWEIESFKQWQYYSVTAVQRLWDDITYTEPNP
jgi:hypothetical protein